ncbi:MAG: hypothetical protein MHM6MM_002194 [Cercozoa sp. M6MM]
MASLRMEHSSQDTVLLRMRRKLVLARQLLKEAVGYQEPVPPASDRKKHVSFDLAHSPPTQSVKLHQINKNTTQKSAQKKAASFHTLEPRVASATQSVRPQAKPQVRMRFNEQTRLMAQRQRENLQRLQKLAKEQSRDLRFQEMQHNTIAVNDMDMSTRRLHRHQPWKTQVPAQVHSTDHKPTRLRRRERRRRYMQRLSSQEKDQLHLLMQGRVRNNDTISHFDRKLAEAVYAFVRSRKKQRPVPGMMSADVFLRLLFAPLAARVLPVLHRVRHSRLTRPTGTRRVLTLKKLVAHWPQIARALPLSHLAVALMTWLFTQIPIRRDDTYTARNFY